MKKPQSVDPLVRAELNEIKDVRHYVHGKVPGEGLAKGCGTVEAVAGCQGLPTSLARPGAILSLSWLGEGG